MSATFHGCEKDVWEMQGITGNDKFVLLAFSKYADHHGYCYPGEERVADDCGLSLRTVQRAKANLTRMKLLKSVRRKDRKTGDPISNLTRINTELIKSMRRPPKRYDDNLIGDFIAFSESDNDGHSVPSDCQVGGDAQNDVKDESGHSVPSDCQEVPVRLTGASRQIGGQSSSSERPANSSSPHPSTRKAARKGRGSGRTKKTTKINKDFSHKHLAIAEALVSDLPGSVTGTDHAKLVPLVCAAFDSGWSPSGLSAHLRANCRVDRVQFHGSVYVKHAEDLPPAGKAEASRSLVELCSVCDEHGLSLDPAACSKDPEAIPHTCLHGQPDPWDSPEYRAERQAERDEAAHVRLRAQEAALREKERRQAREAREAALRAEKEAQEAKAVVERRERAQAFLATAPSTGSEVADRVRAVVLAMAADPPETEDGLRDELDTVVDLGSGLVEATGEISDLVEIVRTLPRQDWLMAIIDRTDEAEAVKRAKAAQEKAAQEKADKVSA